MAIIKLTEPYAVTYMRNMVRDSLSYHGEMAILLRLFHPEIDGDGDDSVDDCPRCSQDGYQSGEEMCPVCYGTNMYDYNSQTGGVKEAYRAWCVFSDRTVTEQHLNYGVVSPDQRQVQTEAFPMLIQNDVIVRVWRWNYQTYTALSPGEFYRVGAVTRNSLRTGAHYGQHRDDVVGQSAQVTLLPASSNGICQYPVQNVTFPEFTIVGQTQPFAVTQPDKNVIYVPVPTDQPPPGTGYVSGSSGKWGPVYTFTQSAAANPWVIPHTLDHNPEVTVTLLINGVPTEVDANVTYPDPQTVNITFFGPQSGTAELT